MSSTHLTLLLAVLAAWTLCQVLAASRNPSDCCLQVSNQEIPHRFVKCYRQQDTLSGCNIYATVFTTIRGRHLCAPVNEDWVRKLKHRKKQC